MSFTAVGQKIGMTKLFDENGACDAVTVVKLYDLVVCGLRTVEKNGYNAIIVGYDEVPEKKLTKSQIGFYT
ncbi:MAG: 50S ribosomal protein L3, partial [Pseudomonadota bacterium]